ncbi:glycosyltransferase family 39 protein [Candidatus Roizmanbacteria bacterium]|nr:glycosyltransferase family 39 protein [Candidatus Roizmanbacteria bacterium]
MKKIDLIILTVVLLVGLGLRLYKFDAPLSDLHSWRQADTASVARNFEKYGYDLLHPYYDDLTPLQSGIENPTGLRYVEFPIYNALFALPAQYIGVFPVEVWGRFVSIFFSLGLISVLYYLALKESNRITAVFAAVTYAVFPFFVFFSRVVLPETMAIATMFFSIFFLYRFFHAKRISIQILLFFASVLLFAISILVKPTTIFYALALFFLFLRKYQIQVLKQIPLYLFFLLGIIPFVGWRLFISQHPEAIPASSWLITTVNTYQGAENIFFKPAFFRWIFFERLNNMILGGYMTVFFVLGVLVKPKKFLLHAIILSGFVYLLTFQGGNVQHEYYQTVFLPAVALAVGLGVSAIFSTLKAHIHAFPAGAITAVVIVSSLFFSYYRIKDFYNNPQDLTQAANLIQTFTKPYDKIITDRLGDTTLLYLSNRRGSPAVYKNISEMKKDGYQYLYTAKSDLIHEMSENKEYQAIFKNDNFAIFKL